LSFHLPTLHLSSSLHVSASGGSTAICDRKVLPASVESQTKRSSTVLVILEFGYNESRSATYKPGRKL
jgi:hypothetical protein